MKLATINRALRNFFFEPQAVHSVALMRVLMGMILLINGLTMWKYLDVYWGPHAMVSFETIRSVVEWDRFSLFDYMANNIQTVRVLALIHLVSILGMILGVFTRTSMVLTFVTLISFHTRNTLILNGGDTIMRNLLFFLMFTPAGDVFSVDHWLAVKRGWAGVLPGRRSPWALRLIQIQFCAIYIGTVLYKLQGSHWMDGTAVYIATRLDDFIRMPLPILNNIFAIKLFTWSTLLVELALGTLIWVKELRYFVLLGGLGLHLGIELVMNIPLFEWVMIAGMAAMIPSSDIESFVSYVVRQTQQVFRRSII